MKELKIRTKIKIHLQIKISPTMHREINIIEALIADYFEFQTITRQFDHDLRLSLPSKSQYLR